MGGTTMTYEDFLLNRGYYLRGEPGGGEDAPRYGWARDIGGGDDAYVQFLEGDNEQDMLRDYQYSLQPPPPPAPPPPPPAPRQRWQPDPNQIYVLGGALPVYTPEPTPEDPTPTPQVDYQSWGNFSADYLSKDHDNGNFFTALDDAVNDAIPGGWATVAAVAVAVATGYVDPTLFATEAGTTALATEGAATLTAAETAALAESSALVDPIMAGAGGTNWAAVGQSALTGAGKGVATNVLTSALTGREITPEGLAISAITGGAGGGAGNLAGQYDLGSIGSGAASGAASGATSAALTGGDVGTSLARGALSGGIGGAGSSLVSDLDPATKAGVQSVASGLTNAAITGNTTNLLPNLIAGGVGSAGTTAAWNALTGDTTPTSGTQKAELEPSTLQIGDTVEQGFGEKVLLADGTMGTISNSGVIVPSDATSDTTTVAFKEPTGTVSFYSRDSTSGSGYRDNLGNPVDSEGNRVNEDGSPYLNPNEIDVAPDNVSITTPTGPLSPDSGQQTEAYGYYNTLISKGVEPSLASKLTGYSPGGSSTGGPGGSGGTGVLPVGPAPLTPPSPTLTAGELTVEGERPVDVAEAPPPAAEEKVPEVTKPTGDVIKGTVTSPSTTIKTTGALPTATTTTQASSGSSAAAPSTSQSGGIPTPITGQSLAAAPVYGNTQILQQLKQLDPKLLSMIAPQLSGQASASPLSPQIPQQATGGNMQQSNPYNTLFQTMLADKGGANPSYGAPMFSAASSMLGYAAGGSATMDDYLTHIKKLRDKEQTGALMSSGLKLLGAPSYNTMGFKDGGHIPEFKTGTTGHYVKGAGDGQSDDIPAMLADGEYVFDADTVASLGNGSSDAGAQLLDHFREAAREHKRSAPVDKIPPKASPLAYMKEALKRHARG